MTGEEVGVNVGFDHMLDPQPGRGGVVEVLPYVPPGVDHGSPPGGLVPDQVSGLRQAAEVILGEPHWRRPPLITQ